MVSLIWGGGLVLENKTLGIIKPLSQRGNGPLPFPHIPNPRFTLVFRVEMQHPNQRAWNLQPLCVSELGFLSPPAPVCPLLHSPARCCVAPVECDDHGLDKAPHSRSPGPLWKFCGGPSQRVEVVAPHPEAHQTPCIVRVCVCVCEPAVMEIPA